MNHFKSHENSENSGEKSDSLSSSSARSSSGSARLEDQVISLINPLVNPLGYDVISIEVQTHRQKTLRIFIDHLQPAEVDTSSDDASGQFRRGKIGIEDCAKVSRHLDEILDTIPEIQEIFPGTYELEVSSPGLDRPLRRAEDFQRFAGQQARVHVYRPLNGEEMENGAYQAIHPKQKNFFGILKGFQEGKVVFQVSAGPESKAGKKTKKKNEAWTQDNAGSLTIKIPHVLISKANLEPEFHFEDSHEREREL